MTTGLQEETGMTSPLVRATARGPAGPSSRVGRYLGGPDEQMIYTCRRHSVVLHPAIGVCLMALVLAIIGGLAAPRHPGTHLAQIGAATFLAGTAFFGCRFWQWRAAGYAFTTDRVLLV